MSAQEPLRTIDERIIGETLSAAPGQDPVRVREVLARAAELKGLSDADVAVLTTVTDPALLDELFHTARRAKEQIYGNRLVLFAPLYVSNLCGNECLYCAFRASNREIRRRALTQAEVAEEVRVLVRQGHKRVLLVAGEAYPRQGFQYVLDCVKTIYDTKEGPGEVRRVNVNVAPLTLDEFRALHDAQIGTYQLFQETYHRETYARVHVGGRKADYEWRISAFDRAMEAGIDDVGVGVLFGLYDWRFEILALLQHVRHLETRFGVGPHTISVPRMEPATGSVVASHPPYPVSDDDFRKIVAILRLAVPYTGMILSTREGTAMRREALGLGISQISAGSRTNPGGYELPDGCEEGSQFSLGDHRTLDEVIRDITSLGFVPSFCTGCYRLGRTGADFMDLAKPGEIKAHCQPNALATFLEYLEDYGSPDTVREGLVTIDRTLHDMDDPIAKRTRAMLDKIRAGERDVYC